MPAAQVAGGDRYVSSRLAFAALNRRTTPEADPLVELTDREREVIIDGRQWICNGSACTARGDDPRPAVACRKLARKLGPVTRFETSQSELDPAALASCNQDHE